MLSKLKRDAAQPQVHAPQRPRKKQKISTDAAASSSTNQKHQQADPIRHYPFPSQIAVSTVYLACPPGVQTGGPEAMHQLCHKINSLSENGDGGITAYMLYIKEQSNQSNSVQHVSHAKTLRAYEMSYSNLKVATHFPMNDDGGKNNDDAVVH